MDNIFHNMTEEEARKQILSMVSAYCAEFHLKGQDEPYKEGDRIPYAKRVYDSEEMRDLVDSALDFWLTAGRYAEQFEAMTLDDFNRLFRHSAVKRAKYAGLKRNFEIWKKNQNVEKK